MYIYIRLHDNQRKLTGLVRNLEERKENTITRNEFCYGWADIMMSPPITEEKIDPIHRDLLYIYMLLVCSIKINDSNSGRF